MSALVSSARRPIAVVGAIMAMAAVMAWSTAAVLAVGGWYEQLSPTTGVLWGVSSANASVAWAVGDAAEILYTTDGGATWLEEPAPAGTPRLAAVAALDTAKAVAVGDNGTILHRNAGAWQARASGTVQPLHGVAGRGTKIYVVGAGGTILTSEDGGLTFAARTTGGGAPWVPYVLHDVAIVSNDALTAYAVGNGGGIIRTADGGATWTTVHPTGVVPSLRSAAHLVGGLQGLAVGNSGTILRTLDGGATWSNVTPPTWGAISLTAVSVASPTTAFAVGSGGMILRTLDTGGSWESMPQPVASFNGVTSAATGTTWAVGTSGKIYVTTSLGNTPTPTATPTPRYLMAFHSCTDTAPSSASYTYVDCPMDIKTHRAHVAWSHDGHNWTPVPGYTTYAWSDYESAALAHNAGSVPDVIRRGNVLYVYTPHTVRRFSLATSSWIDATPVPMTIEAADGSSRSYVDPSAIMDVDGKIVLFYLVNDAPVGHVTTCDPYPCWKYIRSATEVDRTGDDAQDGDAFVEDAGYRAAVQLTESDGTFSSLADPDVFVGPSGYVMYTARQNAVYVTTSADLRGCYTEHAALGDGILTRVGGVPSGHYQGGKYWTYIHRHVSGSEAQAIYRAAHPTLDTELLEADFSVNHQASDVGGDTFAVASPGFSLNGGNGHAGGPTVTSCVGG